MSSSISFEGQVGDTPLLALPHLGEGETQILVKHEGANPGGSIRDRTVKAVLDNAEASGLLLKGDEIIMAGATNSAIAALMFAQRRGYKVVVFHPEDGSTRLRGKVQDAGAALHLTTEDPVQAAANYARQCAGRIFIDAGRREALCDAIGQIGQEILEGLKGQHLATFVTSYSTGSTLRHVTGELRKQYPAVKVIGTSLQAPQSRADHYHDVAPSVSMDRDPLEHSDAIQMNIPEVDAWVTRTLLSRVEGLLLGPKGSAAVLGALCVAPQTRGAIVALSIDGGENYVGAEPESVLDACQAAANHPDPVTALRALEASHRE